MKVAMLVGLPGSGKTYVATREYVPRGFVLVDDPRTRADIDTALRLGRDLVITDPHLVRPENRAQAEQLLEGCDIEWVFFENAPDKAIANIQRRQDGRPAIVDVWVFSRVYTIPREAVTRPIWAP